MSEKKLNELRKKWLVAKKGNDATEMKIIEAQAKMLKWGDPDLQDTAADAAERARGIFK